jgi:hypothetical protein
MKFLKPIWFAFSPIYLVAFLKNNRKPSTISVFFLYEDGWFGSVPIPSLVVGLFGFLVWAVFQLLLGWGK